MSGSRSGSPPHGQHGQVSVSLVAVVPGLIVAALAAIQFALAGYAALSARQRARAAARAAYTGRRPGGGRPRSPARGDARGREGASAGEDRAEVEVAGAPGAAVPARDPGLGERAARARRGRARWLRAATRPGQIELIAGIPALILAALVALQLLAVGYAQSLADGAAEAGAIASADGRDAERGALAAPARAGPPARIEVEARRARSRSSSTRRPCCLRLAGRLGVSSSAYARPAGGG